MNHNEVDAEIVPFSSIYTPDSREGYIVVTEGRRELAEVARWISDITSRDAHVKSSIVAARTELDAARIYHAYGYLPVVLIFADTKAHANSGLLGLESALDVEVVTEVTNPLKLIDEHGHLVYRDADSLRRDEFEREFLRHRADMRRVRNNFFTGRTPQNLDGILSRCDESFARTLEYQGLQGVFPSMVKIGGSMFDVARYGGSREIFDSAIDTICALYNEGFKFVLTVGAGPRGDSEIAMGDAGFTPDYDAVITAQINTLSAELRKRGVNPIVMTQRAQFLMLQPMLYDQKRRMEIMPIVKSIPSGVVNGDSIPAAQSDRVAVAAASYLQLPNVVYVKDTRGVHNRDPKITGPIHLAQIGRYGSGPLQFFHRIFADQISERIAREGLNPETGRLSPGHLIDDAGLEQFTGPKNVFGAYVLVVDGKNPDAIRAAVTGNNGHGSYILK